MTTVAVTSPLPGQAVAMLSAHFSVRVCEGADLVSEDDVAAFVGDADGAVTLLANPVTDGVLERCRALRVVGNVAVGFDNIDLGAADRRGVWVTNTPDVLTEATADLAWALVLAVTRRLREAEAYLRGGQWRGWALDLLLGRSVQGKTIGIIGFGRIGRAVARRAVASGMNVVYTDIEPQDDQEVGARFLPLDELLACSHVVSLHAPMTPETHHLLDHDRLGRLPRGAIVINTARGPLVDEQALVDHLETGQLSGVGLDVFEREPEVHPGLLKRRDVVLLPHVGSATVETRAAMAELAAQNVIAVLSGDEPPTPVVRGR